ncbi:hypothetical protein GGI1_24556 [Acidithiobacillus sp. GGI-221]|nr:hypothetical protein GGI1_24556 [Acidithiobacillus sp. GGI-221]
MGTTNPAAQLMELGQTKFIGAVDEDGVGMGVVDPDSMMVVQRRMSKR